MKNGKFVIGVINLCIVGIIYFNSYNLIYVGLYLLGTLIGTMFGSEVHQSWEREELKSKERK